MVDKTDDTRENAPFAQVNQNENDFDGTSATSVDTQGVSVVKLEDELKQSFIDYAMSVIVDRALPDVRDGLKPVHRRVLYDMYDLNIKSSGQTKKSARVVGDVIGRFHPHGDAAVYETIVRLSQWFSMRAPLIFGQGNFGNIDGDGPAAMRYTEVKMTKIAEAMLTDIDKETVDTYPNYDDSETIPEVLPTRFPNLLVNGSQGIAVGMATNIPPHNLGEVVDGTIAMLDNPEISLAELMHYIKGPDFPTGGYIVGKSGIVDAYSSGKGRVIMRSRTHVETDKSGRKTIVVDEIPYMESKSNIVKQIADLVREKKIEGIAEVNDLSDKDNLVKIAIDLKRDAFEEAVLNNLFEKTNLQTSFAVNMIALVHGQPRQLGLIEILKEFIDFRREVVTRRTVYLLRQDRRKAFDNEGLLVAKDNINKIVDIITSSENTEEAKRHLMSEPWDGSLVSSIIHLDENGQNVCLPQGIDPHAGLHDGKYYLSQEQADKILSLQLSRLTKISQDKIKEEYLGLIQNILGYLEILNSTERLKEVIREELIATRAEYADKRRTDFVDDFGKMSKADLVTPADVILTLSSQGYIKYQDISAFEVQRRGGKGKAAAKVKEDDFITRVLVSNTHDNLLCFTSKGRVFATKVYDLPTSENRTWRGRPIQNYFEIEEGEVITSMLTISQFDEEHYVFLATAQGYVKKVRLSALKNHVERSNGRPMIILTLKEGDSLIGSSICSGDDDIYLFTENYRAVHFCDFYDTAKGSDEDENLPESEGAETVAEGTKGQDEEAPRPRHFGFGVRPSNRGSGTLRGIKLIGDDKVASLIDVPLDGKDTHYCMVLSKNGIGKKMRLEDIPLKNRGTQGVVVMPRARGEALGKVVGACLVDEGDEYLIVTDQGTLIRSPADEIRPMSRQAGGVKLMRVSEGESIIELQNIPQEVAIASQEAQDARRQDRKDREILLDQLNGGGNKEEQALKQEPSEEQTLEQNKENEEI